MGALAWIAGILGAIGFGMSGVMKLTGQEMAVEALTKVGAQDKRMLIGGAEAAGALGLIVGLLSDGAEFLGLAAAVGLIVTMVMAIQAHQKVGDEPKEMMPAAVLAGVCVVYIIGLMLN